MPQPDQLSPRGSSLARGVALFALVIACSISIRPGNAQAGGQVSGTVPGPGGMALVVWSGGSAEELKAALSSTSCKPRSIWASRSGSLIGYLYGAPDAVNVAFRGQFPSGSMPAQTPLVLVCEGVTVAPAPPPSGTAGLQDAEAQMFALVNQARVANGLAPFALDPALTDVARRHSADMVARGFFGHVNPDGLDPFQRMAAAGIAFRSAAEIVAWAADASAAHTALMNSPAHRANILNPQLGRIGIGIVRKDSQYIMVTQLFRD
jgi:uncharacterized protein YkwD